MKKKIMIIALCLSLFLLIVGALCAINEASRATTYGILLGLSFSWFSFLILWFFLIYDSKLKLKISVFAGMILWFIRIFFMLPVLLIIVFVFLPIYDESLSKTLQILLSALFSYLIPMFVVLIFGIEEAISNYKKRKVEV